MSNQPKPKESSELQSLEIASMFQAIAGKGFFGILILDEFYRIEFANGMAAWITGYKVDELLGKNFTSLLDEKGRTVFHRAWQMNYKCIPHLSYEVEIITAASTPMITEMGFADYTMQSGEKKYFIYLRDISDQKRLIGQLRESERKYQDLFDQVDQGITITTKEGKFIDCNPAILKILSYESKEEFLKIDIAKNLYTNPEDRKTFQKIMERDGYVKNYEVEFKKKTGEKIPMLLTSRVMKNEKGEVIGYQGLNIDISERILMEQSLRKERSFLTNLLESSANCIVAADTKGTVIFFNKAAEKLTGYSAEEAIGKFNITRFYPLEVAKDAMKKLRSEDFGGPGKLESLEITLRDIHGEEIPVELSASIVYEGDKEVASLGIFTDLREKIKIEDELHNKEMRLLQAEKMASLGSLAAGVAHEINNPLGGILIYANLLREEFEANNDPRVEDLKRIVEEAIRCREIVRSLLEFGRQTESQFEQLDINQAINDGLFFLENQALFHNIKIVKHLASPLPIIQGNPNQLKQVFMNMMVNAAEAMSEGGGSLTITTGINSDPSSIFITFQDTGIGIDPAIQSKIFDPFFTTKEVGKGTGLGLSTSYGIIQSHHGNIQVKSEAGEGATFTIFLPVSQ
ncbi:MAG: PAS domain S-box protein [Proteobacteria bacterium]|nr:PAS domain S-box protein [Pseudomonadota bacterium]